MCRSIPGPSMFKCSGVHLRSEFLEVSSICLVYKALFFGFDFDGNCEFRSMKNLIAFEMAFDTLFVVERTPNCVFVLIRLLRTKFSRTPRVYRLQELQFPCVVTGFDAAHFDPKII